MSDMIETVARAIARANGDEFANAFKDKSRWIAKRGMSGGRFRDVNEPFQSDYLDMAKAALNAIRSPSDEMITAMHDGAMGGFGEDMGEAQRQYIVDCWADMIVAAGADQ